MTLPTYQQFIQTIQQSIQHRSDILLESHASVAYQTPYGEKAYPLYKIYSANISETDPIVLIRAGLHGDEIFGPLTIMTKVADIFSYAHEHGVKLIIFPLDNPSGFEAGTRYNIEGDSGDAGNNDYLRYRVLDGQILPDLGVGTEFIKWYWSSDPALNVRLPKETAVSHHALRKISHEQVKAVLDIHADNFIHIPGTYHYVFGNCSIYQPITDSIKNISHIFADEYIDSGYLNIQGYSPELVQEGVWVPDQFNPKTDVHGCIIRHDGSLPDLFYRMGTHHCITIEVTGATPIDTAHQVNLTWIRGMIDFSRPL